MKDKIVFLACILLLALGTNYKVNAADKEVTSQKDAFFQNGALWYKEITGFPRKTMDRGLLFYFDESAKNVTINDNTIIHRTRWAAKEWNQLTPAPNLAEISTYKDADIVVYNLHLPDQYVGIMKPQDANGVWCDKLKTLHDCHKEWIFSKIWINKSEIARLNAEVKQDKNHPLYFDYEDTKKLLMHELGHALSYEHQPYGTKSIMVQGQITTPTYKVPFNTLQSFDIENWRYRFK